MKKYLVTQDIGAIVGAWAQKKCFNIPNADYFNKLSLGIIDDLQSLFNQDDANISVELIKFNDINQKLNHCLSSNGKHYCVSLDKVYAKADFYIEINRGVVYENRKWTEIGEISRPGCKPLDDQIDELAEYAKNKDVLLVDDGCWSGGTLKKIIGKLLNRSVNICKILVGMKIGDVVVHPELSTEHLFYFPAGEIVDWVCERDFFPGISFGGKTLINQDNSNIGAYYLFGMGDYKKWASLNVSVDLVKWFTRRRLHDAIKLFERIETLSNKRILVSDIERIPFGMERIIGKEDFFTNALKKQIDLL